MNAPLEPFDFDSALEHIKAIGTTLADLAPMGIRAMNSLCALKSFVEENAVDDDLAQFNALARDVICVFGGIHDIWDSHLALVAALLMDDPEP